MPRMTSNSARAYRRRANEASADILTRLSSEMAVAALQNIISANAGYAMRNSPIGENVASP